MSGRPICHACNRPFDPSSPGATLTLGPTCAKRAGVAGKSETGHSQLPLAFESRLNLAFIEDGADLESLESVSEQLSPRLQARREKVHTSRTVQTSNELKNLPRHLRDKYLAAKDAFDALYSRYNGQSTKHGEEALFLYETVVGRDASVHTLGDPTLPWLEPEQNMHLVIEPNANRVYLWRILNEIPTMIEIGANRDRNIGTILNFTRALASYRQSIGLAQLTLI